MSDAAPQTRRVAVGLIVVALALAAGGGLFLYLRSASTSEVSGSLTIGDATFEPRTCRSGKLGENPPRDRLRFHGVELLSPSGQSLRVVDDPASGPSVLILDPGAAPRALDRDACARFEVSLRETGELIMEVWGMEGTLDLDCPDARGQVRFLRCYSGR